MDQIRDERRQPVIIAEGGLQLRDAQRVVFVDDRDRAELEQRVQRVPDVQVLGPMLQIVGGEQDLGGMKAEFLEEMIIRLDQGALPHSRDGLKLREVFGTPGQTKAADPRPNGSRTDQNHTKPFGPRFGELIRKGFDLRLAQMPACVGQNARSDLHDDGRGLGKDLLT